MSATEDEMIDFIEKSRKEFHDLHHQTLLMSVSDINKWSHLQICIKGYTYPCCGAFFIITSETKKLSDKYQDIQSGEKISLFISRLPILFLKCDVFYPRFPF